MAHDDSAQMPPTDSRDERLVLAAAKEASRETMAAVFGLIGVNIADYNSMQTLREDLAFVRSLRQMKELQDDLKFVGSIRAGARKAGGRAFLTIVTLIAGAAAVGAWEMFRTMILAKGP